MQPSNRCWPIASIPFARLAIAAELIRAHGGTIMLVDMTGPGAVFEIVIPDRPGRDDMG